jgi:NADH-quinone oxidoreductase subunit L
MIFITFFGEAHTEVEPAKQAGLNMSLPLIILAALAIAGGWFGLAPLASVLPDGGVHDTHHGWLPILTAAIPMLGLVFGVLIFGPGRRLNIDALVNSKLGDRLRRFWFAGWGFDTLYDALLVKPIVALAGRTPRDIADRAYDFMAWLARSLHRVLALTQTGRLRWYAVNMAAGVVVILLIVLGVG